MVDRYAHIPGRDVVPASRWPRDSSIAPPAGKPLLVMAIHPHCPCSRASIGELAVIMRHCRDRLDARVLFFRPQSESLEWAHTDLWKSATELRGVQLVDDVDAREAHRFSAATSGFVALYDPSGELIFSGGITASRGHYGDNDGVSSVIALVNGRGASVPSTPVYGCSLYPERETASARTSSTYSSHEVMSE